MENTKRKKIIVRAVCITLAVILLIPISYLLYVVFSYRRVEDFQTLTVANERTEKAPVGEELKLVTYNVGFGAYSADYSFFMDGGEHARALSEEAVSANIGGAIQTVNKENPHFALFQEVDTDGTRSYHIDQSNLFAAGFASYTSVFAQNYDSAYLFYPFHQPIGANRSGIMTFSSYQIASATRRSLPIEDSLYKFLDLDRAYSVSVIPTSGERSLVLYNVHLSAYTSDGTIADEQLKMLCADMEAEYQKGNYAVAAGDFNKDMLGDSSKYFTRVEGDFTWAQPLNTALLPDCIKSYSGTNAPSCRNADSPYRADGTDFVLSVDGVLLTDNVQLISCETVDVGFAYSDHNPVSVRFLLKSE